MYHPYQSGSDKDRIFEMFTPAFQGVRNGSQQQSGFQNTPSQPVREYFEGNHQYQLTSDNRFAYPVGRSNFFREGFKIHGQLGNIAARHSIPHCQQKRIDNYCKQCPAQGQYCLDLCGCSPSGPTPPPTGPTPPPTGPTPSPTPAPTKINRDAPLFGYWYFTFNWQPYDTPCSGNGIPGSPNPDINNYINIANRSGVFKDTVKENTSFNLGIGVYEGAGGSWGSNFQNDGSSYTTSYKILNFGGWGSCDYGPLNHTLCPSGPNVVWTTDIINTQANLIGTGAAGLTKIRQNGYNGISLDIEAVAPWDGNTHTPKTFAKAIFDLYKGFDDKNFVRILTIPGKGIGGNQYTKQGGNPENWCQGTSMMDWFPIFMQMEQNSNKNVFEKICLMEYGKGLDTEISEMGIGDVEELISNLTAWNNGGYLSNSPKIKLDPSRICLGLSFGCNNWWDDSKPNYYFKDSNGKDRLKDVFNLASGGIHVWGKNAPPKPTPYPCGSATSIQDCNTHPNCTWGKTYDQGDCHCMATNAQPIQCGPTPPTPPTPPSTPTPTPAKPCDITCSKNDIKTYDTGGCTKIGPPGCSINGGPPQWSTFCCSGGGPPPAPSPPPAPTPPTPSSGKCHAMPGTVATDAWCNSNCSATSPNCPPNLCKCD